MSLYLPKSAVVKENYMQMVRRVRIEKQYESAIKGFQELLKTQSTVISGLRSLGLTQKHAVALEMRLQWQNEQEEEQARIKADREARKAAAAAQSNGNSMIQPQEAAPIQLITDGKMDSPVTPDQSNP